MIVAGYYFAGSHHEEGEEKQGTKVCYSTEGEEEEESAYACEIREPEVDLYRETPVRYLGCVFTNRLKRIDNDEIRGIETS
eukprot:1486344-Pyramimonas_sp.AAC.2